MGEGRARDGQSAWAAHGGCRCSLVVRALGVPRRADTARWTPLPDGQHRRAPTQRADAAVLRAPGRGRRVTRAPDRGQSQTHLALWARRGGVRGAIRCCFARAPGTACCLGLRVVRAVSFCPTTLIICWEHHGSGMADPHLPQRRWCLRALRRQNVEDASEGHERPRRPQSRRAPPAPPRGARRRRRPRAPPCRRAPASGSPPPAAAPRFGSPPPRRAPARAGPGRACTAPPRPDACCARRASTSRAIPV